MSLRPRMIEMEMRIVLAGFVSDPLVVARVDVRRRRMVRQIADVARLGQTATGGRLSGARSGRGGRVRNGFRALRRNVAVAHGRVVRGRGRSGLPSRRILSPLLRDDGDGKHRNKPGKESKTSHSGLQ